MMLSSEKLRSALHKVKLIIEHKDLYCIDPGKIPVSVEDVQYVIQEMYELKIEKYVVSYEGEFIRGMVERYRDGTARVLIKSDQSEAWQRFIAVKEMAHLAIDAEDDWSPRGVDTIDALIYEQSLGVDSTKETKSEVQSEMLAEIVAIEILYPFAFRQNDIKQLEEDSITVRALALHYDVPELAIGRALHPAYMKVITKLWDLVDNA